MARDVVQVVDCLSNKWETLTSNSSATKEEKSQEKTLESHL
jgi:hypothetical protein